MHDRGSDAGTMAASANLSMVNSRKAAARGVDGMSAEELRMNRRLLEQISKFKKETTAPMMGNFMETNFRSKSSEELWILTISINFILKIFKI